MSKSFPTDRLPRAIARIIRDVSAGNNLSVNFLAIAAIFALAVAIGRSRVLRVKATWVVCANLFCGIVGHPGTAKTHALNFAIRPLIEYRENNQQLLVNDTTVEALLKLHSINPYGISLYRDELAGFFSGMNRYHSAGGDEETWLSLYSGSPVRVTRKTNKEDYLIPNPCVGLVGTIQPDALAKVVADERNNGFWERFLWVTSEDEQMTRPWCFGVDDDELLTAATADWRHILHETLNRGGFGGDEPETQEYTLAPEAAERLMAWQHNREEVFAAANPERLGAYRKLAEMTLRISLILQIAREVTGEAISTGRVDAVSADNAIAIAEFFGAQADVVRELAHRDENNARTAFAELLPETFTTKDALDAVKIVGISRRTFFNWVSEGFFAKTGRGSYAKINSNK